MKLFNNPIHVSLLVAIVVCVSTWAHAHPGDGLIIDKQGVIYFGWIHPFAGPEHHACIWKLDKQGDAHQVFKSQHSSRDAQSSNIWISLGLDGHIYCLERQYLGEEKERDVFVSDLWRLETGGKKMHILGPERGRSPLGNSAFVVDRDGTIIHATNSHVIDKRKPDGTKVTLAGGVRGHKDGTGDQAQFEHIASMAWGPNDTLYVNDRGTIRLVSKAGTVTTLASGLAAFENNGPVRLNQTHFFDMTIDSNGNVFGADWGSRRVLKVSSTGEVSTLYRCKPPWSPEGIALHGDVLYILETTFPESPTIRPRVRERKPNGTFSTIFEFSD